jgi:hypothetical protein
VVLDVVLARRWRAWLVLLPLTSGIVLIAFAVLKLPVWPVTLTLVAFGVVVWTVVIRRLDAAQRRHLGRVVGNGALAGLVATIAYDATRYGLVALLSWSISPFAAFERFGQAVLGEAAAGPAVVAVGAAVHQTNGITFGASYAIFVARPGVATGIAWALTLEVLMLLVYPELLGVALPGEFVPMSLLGHLAFGATLGIYLRRRLGTGGDRPNVGLEDSDAIDR